MSILFAIPEVRVKFELTFDDGVIEINSVRRISLQLETLLRQFCNDDLGNATIATFHPSDLLYINFTSASKGKPTGVTVRHRNFAAAATYQEKAFGFSERSHVHDFSAYAFYIT
ncbi:hypothetical protein LX36DRAFT_653719 [Colletotrichum falcatum]|nr:hypothetical protein LX36DRAFT_653719 [Colletotrichum falcatum]